MPKRTRNESPQKQAMREMMSVLPEGALDEELDEEFGHSRYDYHNKEADNSRNGHSRKTIFPSDPSDDSLLKMLYLEMIDITKKRTGHRRDWGQICSQLEICFEERLDSRHHLITEHFSS